MPLKLSAPEMVMFLQVAAKEASTVTVAPATIVTSSNEVGIALFTQVPAVFHDPPVLVEVNITEGLS